MVIVPELVDRTFEGTVARNAKALASGTRTFLTEVDVDNKSGERTAGLYSVSSPAIASSSALR